MARRLLIVCLAGALGGAASGGAAAAASEPLVLERADTPGLKARPTSSAAARAALAAALRPAILPTSRPVRQVAARFIRPATELWSIALVYPNRDAAEEEFTDLLQTVREGRLGSVPAPLGEPGRLIRPRGRAVVLWRRGPAVAAILLTRTGVGRRALGNLAVSYARLGDAHLIRTVAATAWDRALSDVSPNGKRSRRSVFELFALAYDPLPGTRLPQGPRGEPEGTLAARSILRIWPTLSAPQRAAALKALGLTGVSIGKGATSSDAVRSRRIYGDPSFVLNPQLQKIADDARVKYEARMGTALKSKLVVGTSPNPRNGGADALAMDEGGIFSGKTSVCRIRIAPSKEQVEFTLAHEVFHCFQYSLGSLDRGELLWVDEGTADWAAFSVTGNYNGSRSLGDYLTATCRIRLDIRRYSASGFFGHVDDTTGSLWPRIGPIVRAGDNLSAYAAAGGVSTTMLDSWASSVAVEPGFGLNWTVESPVKPPAGVRCTATPLFPGEVRAEPFTVELYDVGPGAVGADAKKPILHLTIKGHARISDGAVDMAGLADAYFCLVGDCKCPPDQEGTPPAAVKLNGKAYLGLTGGRVGAGGQAMLEPLDQYCKKKQKKPKRPGGPPVGGGGSGSGGGGCGSTVDASIACGEGCTAGCGSSNGDPHLTTLDGRFYDFQGAGEYTLVRSSADNFEVQAREEPYPSSPNLAVNTAVAMRVGSDRIGVYRGEPLPVRLNGLGFVPPARARKLRGGGTIRLVAGQVEVTWPDGSLARVFSVGSWGVAVIVKPAPSRQGTLRGLLGNFDGNESNDFETRAGRKLDIRGTLESKQQLYGVFGESWRVTQRQSLFDYAHGQSTRTFTERSFPREVVSASSLSPRARRRAERICRSLRITIKEVFEACIVDVAGTGDGAFATAGAQLQRTAVRFGRPGRAGAVDTRWTVLGGGGSSNSIVPSVALDGPKVVVTYPLDDKAAEAVTFTPSLSKDAEGLRQNTITTGWNLLYSPVLLPRPGGGLQALLSGADPSLQFGTWLAPRNPDGSFGTPVLATDKTSNVGGWAAPAPDGSPLWASASSSVLTIWRGSTDAAGNDLSGVLRGTPYIPSVGRDGMGRYWLAWYVLGGQGGPLSGVYIVQIDPTTLSPLGSPQRAPRSETISNENLRLALACTEICRLVYHQERGLRDWIVSWAPGESAGTLVARAQPSPWLAATYASGGRLWVAWYDAGARSYRVLLGNAKGGGGTPRSVGQPSSDGSGFVIAAISTPIGLVLVSNWRPLARPMARFVNVVPPG